jgi:predicted hexulose-6-phosphate isomerase
MSAAGLAADGVILGAYEKALRWTGSWDRLFGQAADAGFGFVDLSIDESPERSARLEWSGAERAAVRAAADRQGVAIGGVCLSVHRAVAPGSANPRTRHRATEILLQGVDFCADLRAPELQIAGYFTYYEESTPNSREDYLRMLVAGAAYASRRGVMLGIENVDGADVTSISNALDLCDSVGSAYLQLYPDIGNLAGQGLDVAAELAAGAGRMLAIHAKDVRPGQPRRVPMGEGIVPWDSAFAELARQRWSGRMMIEMWNDDRPDSAGIATRAREFIAGRLAVAGMRVVDGTVPRSHRLLESPDNGTNETVP